MFSEHGHAGFGTARPAGHVRRSLGCAEQWGAGGGEPRTWVCESSYRAGSWSRSRRVVQVVVERPGELIPRCFWLLTSMPSEEMSGEDLLALYRKRGKAEGHLGELMSVVSPALSSTSRRKSHYRAGRSA